MKNLQVLIVVAGAAGTGLVIGNLVSRPSRPVEVAPPGAPARVQLREVPTASLPSPMAQPAPAESSPNKKGLSDERKAVDLQPQDPAMGPASARVTVVEFSDFQCPFCSRASKTVQQLRDMYGDKIRIVFKQHPLPFHENAALAAQAALEANAQGAFWPFHDRLFANQKALARADLETTAQSLGLDMARFRTALDSGIHRARVDQDGAQAVALGATGTPAFFINGRLLAGAKPIDVFKQAIDEELTR